MFCSNHKVQGSLISCFLINQNSTLSIDSKVEAPTGLPIQLQKKFKSDSTKTARNKNCKKNVFIRFYRNNSRPWDTYQHYRTTVRFKTKETAIKLFLQKSWAEKNDKMSVFNRWKGHLGKLYEGNKSERKLLWFYQNWKKSETNEFRLLNEK